MKGMTRDREAQIKSLPYEEAMRMCWMWIKQGVIDSPGEFIKAVQLIQSTKECLGSPGLSANSTPNGVE